MRKTNNFSALMDILRKNLSLTYNGKISVVTLKCYARLIGSFRMEPGIYPGWHMNKKMCPGRTTKYERTKRIAAGHTQRIEYLATITI